MDKYVLLTYNLGDLPTEISSAKSSKLVYGYLLDLLNDNKYDNKEFCKRVTIIQFIKFTLPSFGPWAIPTNEKFMAHYFAVPMYTENKPKKEDFKVAEEMVFKQSLEHKIIDNNNYELISTGKKQVSRIYAINPMLAVETLEDYIKNIFSETNLNSLSN